MLELEKVRELLSEMGIKTGANLLDTHLETAAKTESTYLSFLLELLNSEKEERKRRSEETRIKLSKLPHHKTVEEFDFHERECSATLPCSKVRDQAGE